VALRLVCDSQWAEDVTQGAFLALAQNAGRLADRPVLSGWLHRTTQNIASKQIRTEVRRRAREQEAVIMNVLLPDEADASWEEIAPQLDTALSDLVETDRDAIMLRYFEGKTALQIARSIGVSAEAAQKRVGRAVERLREILGRRGVTVCTSGLAAALSVHAVQAAPVHLPFAIVHAAAQAATPAAGAATVAAATKAIVAKALIGTVLAATITTTSFQVMRSWNSSRSAKLVFTTASGLKYHVLKRGAGNVHPKETDMVSVHCRGTLADGSVFENSVDRGHPLTVPVNSMIPGWVEGLQLMKAGDKFSFEIPPNLAYGDQSRPKIPSNSTLLFEIELLAIN
jgi:RNA polymerase sigma factor (sigma-70 family)